MAIKVRSRRLRIIHAYPDGSQEDPGISFIHDLYKVKLKNGEIWAVDPTVAQFGIQTPSFPWLELEQRLSAVVEVEEGFHAAIDDLWEDKDPRNDEIVLGQVEERRVICMEIERWIDGCAKEVGGHLNAILEGSDATFAREQQRFSAYVEQFMGAFMSDHYSGNGASGH